jgi:hypothetical protein
LETVKEAIELQIRSLSALRPAEALAVPPAGHKNIPRVPVELAWPEKTPREI